MPDVPPIIEKLIRTAEGFDFQPPYQIYVPAGYPDLPDGYEYKQHKIYQSESHLEYELVDAGGSFFELAHRGFGGRALFLYTTGTCPDVVVDNVDA